jgi:hypothetical protein
MTSFQALFTAADVRLPRLPKSGICLLDCLRALPGITDFLAGYKIQSEIVRGKVELTYTQQTLTHNYKFIVHPDRRDILDRFFDIFTMRAEAVNRINFFEIQPSGGIIQWSNDPINGLLNMVVPNGSMYNSEEVRFWPYHAPLNEFGYLYVALFIAGNYARYYPDRWLFDVEQSSPLALAIEELIRNVEHRMPLLALSEMSRIYHVPIG